VPWISGCSFVFMQPPPDNHSKLRYFDCVSSTAAPVTDTVNAAFTGLTAAFAGGETGDADDPPAVWVFGGVAALYAASAIYGFVSVSECDSAKQSLAHRIDQREADNARRIQALERQLKSPRVGCSSDADCKGARVCVGGSCNSAAPEVVPVAPMSSPEVVPESAPVPQ